MTFLGASEVPCLLSLKLVSAPTHPSHLAMPCRLVKDQFMTWQVRPHFSVCVSNKHDYQSRNTRLSTLVILNSSPPRWLWKGKNISQSSQLCMNSTEHFPVGGERSWNGRLKEMDEENNNSLETALWIWGPHQRWTPRFSHMFSSSSSPG